ncbi:hypothetical protein G5714_022119 [Onychostoma macrolepis]|uniref:Uncharacterized protein n=1 Tax=Onychostoma macrolepis TaxID=369639 RepID=A0A7J6BTP2_9TELE|nr:hypothetical protein G5714_022119 [Onychostoma macrolepis]
MLLSGKHQKETFALIYNAEQAEVNIINKTPKLSVMTPRVLQVSRSPLKEKFRCMIDDCEDGRLKKGLQLAAILLLPALFKEDPGLLFEVEGHSQVVGRVILCSMTTLCSHWMDS